MSKLFRLLVLLWLCVLAWPAAAGLHSPGNVEPLTLLRDLEPELRAASENCAYSEWCCHCSTAVSADFIAAPERRDQSSDVAPAACMDVQPSTVIRVAGVAATFAAQATAPGPNRPLYLLHLNLRR
jgi:hypothetical protein